MAYEMNIRGTQDKVKIRSPWAAALLPFVTLGIYHLVWWYRINREMRDYGQAKGYDLGQNPTNSVLALFPGRPDHRPGADHVLAWNQAGAGRLEHRRHRSRSTGGSRSFSTSCFPLASGRISRSL